MKDSKLQNAIIEAGRRRRIVDRIKVNGYGEVMQRKEDLAAGIAGIDSLRDFGGCYLVHGRYLLQAAIRRRLSFASMIDVNPVSGFLTAVEEARVQLPLTEFEVVKADFREPALYKDLRETDAALLYEVLLHQENYLEVIRNVCGKTKKFICVAQPNLREEFFILPASATLLQFYDEPLKDLLREGSFWPKEPRVERYTSAHWMWGHTTSHVIEVFRGFGWSLQQGVVVDNVCGPCWEYFMGVFERCP